MPGWLVGSELLVFSLWTALPNVRMKSSLAAEAAAAIFVLSEDHWSVRRAHTPSIEKIAAVAAIVPEIASACVLRSHVGSEGLIPAKPRTVDRAPCRSPSFNLRRKSIPYEYQS